MHTINQGIRLIFHTAWPVHRPDIWRLLELSIHRPRQEHTLDLCTLLRVQATRKDLTTDRRLRIRAQLVPAAMILTIHHMAATHMEMSLPGHHTLPGAAEKLELTQELTPEILETQG